MKTTRTTAFGRDYFNRYYLRAATRVISPEEMQTRAALICAILRQADIRVRSVLDLGCGVGLLRKPFNELLPRAKYTGVDTSEYLCKRYGWILGSVVDYRPSAPADLLVCYDVLQYLDDAAAAKALANFARIGRAALYVSALTREDWQENCDKSKTDRDVFLRPGAWYRRRLKRHFSYLGFGTWLRKDVTALLWDLERSKP